MTESSNQRTGQRLLAHDAELEAALQQENKKRIWRSWKKKVEKNKMEKRGKETKKRRKRKNEKMYRAT